MSKERDTVASIAQARFGMTEAQYLKDRIERGWSAAKIASELGLSRAAVTRRVARIATKNKPWRVNREAA